ncbi:sulfotransferase domain-containing protein [Mesorhizobium hawassense]|nr:sulfotransferase domain-containing protein [Mesorhizobium hawassense]
MNVSTPIGSPTRFGQYAVGVRVMGTPRSGTNLAKHLIARYLEVPVVFDRGFWKHGIFPALMDGRDMRYGELPIVVVSKDPVTQLLSWYRQARNDTLFKPSGNLAAFLSKPFELRQDFTEPRKMEYRFRTPADYWNQFYFAMDALRRTDIPVHFLRYEQLVSEPAACLNSISRFLDPSRAFDASTVVAMPEHKLGASNDIERGESPTIDQSRFDPARAELASALARIGWRNASVILRGIDDDVLEATGRAGFRKTCLEAIGVRAMLRSLVGFW